MTLTATLLCAGCGFDPAFNREGMLNIRRLDAERRSTNRAIRRQEKLFYLLRADVGGNRLPAGSTRDSFVKRYGESIGVKGINCSPLPVPPQQGEGRGTISPPLAGGGRGGEVLIYRHPTRYFSSEIVYVYFDGEGKLSSAEVVEK